jgi:hypothetical protein
MKNKVLAIIAVGIALCGPALAQSDHSCTSTDRQMLNRLFDSEGEDGETFKLFSDPALAQIVITAESCKGQITQRKHSFYDLSKDQLIQLLMYGSVAESSLSELATRHMER